jgi:hypothetical protein
VPEVIRKRLFEVPIRAEFLDPEQKGQFASLLKELIGGGM